MQLRRVREGTQIEEDHMRNRQMIVHWLMANTRRSRCGARRQDLLRHGRRDGVPRRRRRLLAEVQRIKSKATTRPRRRCSKRYGVHFDPELRDEIVARVDQLKLPSYTGFVMPKLEAGARRRRCRS